MPRKREIPTGMEEQNLAPETVHDEGPEARPHDVRRQVRRGVIAYPLFRDLQRILLFCQVEEKVKVKHFNLWLIV